ncbi:DUF4426 domain-containing protein [Catenovulum sediminis]|uniref:DUF4426 domain-containing protein n=1 Tax=Catenovulum sediminis TaxID=1740262 RepID=A0ABV1RKZ1_9ALTE|nr:DUF4426 domain-containing protein [Catenovulum sediminis]
MLTPNLYRRKCITLSFWLLSALTSLISIAVYANENPNLTVLDNWEIHHIAFPSTFIQPATAKAVGIDRRGNNGVINISVLDTDMSKKPMNIAVSGYAQNLVGHRKELDFKQVDEGDAIYYLAQIRHSNEETFRFFIRLTDPKTGIAKSFQFQQKMWVD